jgi:hypothetical protein
LFSRNGRAPLSPDGLHYASFEAGELRIYSLPSRTHYIKDGFLIRGIEKFRAMSHCGGRRVRNVIPVQRQNSRLATFTG